MASIITIAGEQLFAQKAQANQQLDIDTFIFANVPGQDPAAPIDRDEAMPVVGQQVHTQIVQQVGRINDNVVVYSTVLDSVTGDFDFNWVGLYSSVNDTLVAINHIPTTPKTATAAGVAGNTLNRNFGIEYSGIADLTGITVAPETWQLDFTARLSGMDELTRNLAKDLNGKDSFIDDGFKIVPRATVNTFDVTLGAGYVSGLRIEQESEHILTITDYPKFVYVDAYFDGDASSTWKPQHSFTISDSELSDYTDANGKAHFVVKLATVTAADTIEDLRTDNKINQEISKHLNSEESHKAGTIDFSEYNETAKNVAELRVNLSEVGQGKGDEIITTKKGKKLDKVISMHNNYDNRVNESKIVGQSSLVVRSNQRKPKLAILLGQSGAEGRGTTSDAGINNDIVGYRESIQIWKDSAFENLRIPTTSTDQLQNNDALPGRYGIELALANYSSEDGEVIHLVKVTYGGTFMGQWLANEDVIPVDSGDPNDPENDGDLNNATPSGGVLDDEAWGKVQAAKTELDALYGAGGYEEVLIMIQGEANGGSVTQRPRFKRQRLTFNNKWRERLGSTLRIISPHILAYNKDYIYINSLLDEIEYEDKLNYTISNSAYLPTYDGIHLNYKGLCHLGKAVYNEIFNPTTKRALYPGGNVVITEAAPSLTILDHEETFIITGTTSINYTNKEACKNNRIIRLWRQDVGEGVLIRHLSGDANTYALFSFVNESTRLLAEKEFIKFVGYEGTWHQVIES